MNLHFDFRFGLKDGEIYTLKEILIPHILAAIGTNEYLRDKIQSDYHQKRNLYSSVNEEFSYSHHNYFELFPSVERLMIKKALQMYLYAESQQKGDDFLTVYLNEGFKRIVDFSKKEARLFPLLPLSIFLTSEKSNYPQTRNGTSRPFICICVVYKGNP